MGLGQSQEEKSDTINWNNIKTDNMSSSIPNFNGLSYDARKLIASLNIPSITESETSEVNINNILDKINNNLDKHDQKKFNKLMEQVSHDESEGLSNTSPFISSEMYEHLVNSKTSEIDQVKQKGGAKKKPVKKNKNKKGGAESDDSSDTSSTSSDSSLEDILDSTEEEIKEARDKKLKKAEKHNPEKKYPEKHNPEKHNPEKKYPEKHPEKHNPEKKYPEKHPEKKYPAKKPYNKTHQSKKVQVTKNSDLSYNSSSAHTDGVFSESEHNNHNSESSSANQSSSSDHTSVTNENNNMLNTSISVNTDDINMVSDY